ncbi:fungal-specific transcription factor domain-containing protein [Penicillium argentinense]|uniref:Fungal-specific transcription factor domain-containing protein n=1 Tax=Penicillium argentinense TaxID=1131581 RepID=A0A9W9FPC3_9EURO|nr:fungal-specific transcription factor domain-containing protein [Penicillium argentinense]KAJ5103884.1 fungal-specific transcription factor domain-containing protein [Penicillium argentinense]
MFKIQQVRADWSTAEAPAEWSQASCPPQIEGGAWRESLSAKQELSHWGDVWMMNPSTNQAPPRRYGFACLMCRRWKIKCDGKKPNCANCVKAKEICSYRESPGYNTHLVQQLQVSKKRVDDLEAQLRDLASLDHEERDRRLSEIVRDFDDLNVVERSPGQMTELSQSYDTDRDPESEDLPYGCPAGFSVGEHGKYYGATSRFHPLDSSNSRLIKMPGTEKQEHKASEEYHRKWLASNVRFQESIENVALKNLDNHADVPLDVCDTPLQIYWTWQAPLHNCVYRRSLGGPYCSPFLVNVIFAHAMRHTKDEDTRFNKLEKGEYFLRKAKELLLIEMEQEKPKICTIQGLLILAGRQCATGKSSEGWLYTGMAFRMLTDLGLHLYRGNLEGLDGLEPDNLEVRKRLYLSAYAWDKSISLCLGRPPSLTDLPYSPDSLFDTSDNDTEWKPVYLHGAESAYPVTESLNTLNFIHFCKLAKHLKLQNIFELEAKLRSFYQALPEPLRIQQSASSACCPPPHIFCLNILYHTMLILIFRPFFAWSRNEKLREHALAIRAQQVCTEAATKVNDFFRLYGSTFNFQNQTYLVSYCVYTAATIDIQQVQYEDSALAAAASNRLSTTLKMLESEARQTPGIKRSTDIIKSHLTPCPEERTLIPKTMPTYTGTQVQSKLEIRVPPDGGPVPSYQRTHNKSTLPTRPSYGQLKSPLSQSYHSAEAIPPQLQTHSGIIEAMEPRREGQLSPQDQMHDENIGSLMTQAMDVDTTWHDWEFFNAGGGFVPDNGGLVPFDPAYQFNMY